ncbi:malonyl-CoA decarboxylase [uncultured Paracoccus sp.]|uniref:malonyl-CoA decarboxylase n=1 Tax=uncultured Paracoccus sp. TaxID=189685 RepID=UPI00261C4396|nr:malonyl-CoA decarboxylase [uncultured Paracoccus sp.]
MIGEVIRPARLYDRLSSLVDLSARVIRRPGRSTAEDPRGALETALRALPSMRSETRALATATQILTGYDTLDADGRLWFFRLLRDGFDPDPEALAAAAREYADTRDHASLQRLTTLAEPPRQEVLRRLNAVAGGTAQLVAMRADLLALRDTGEDFARLDADLRHLLRSWFNRGFLMLVRIDWTSPASLLEKLIQYEAVHEIQGFADLRRRVLPPDRRCYAYLHPAMPDDPLIFVEIALMRGLPNSIQAITAVDRPHLAATLADTAAFYSISNCQEGLAGISFGNLLIKNVVAELQRELPNLTRFVTLSPMPGLRRWLEEQAAGNRQAAEVLDRRNHPALPGLAAHYLLKARDRAGRPRDPVARFHLGNGAEAHRVIPDADRSDRGIAQSLGMMVNYLYDLPRIDARHDAFTEKGIVAAPGALAELARSAAQPEGEPR